MKKIIFSIALLGGSFYCKSQEAKIYNIDGVLVFSADNKPVASVTPIKTKQTTFSIGADSTVLLNSPYENKKFKITKKVDDDYFEMSDGLKNFIVKIEHKSPVYKRYTGSVRVEAPDNTKTIYFFK